MVKLSLYDKDLLFFKQYILQIYTEIRIAPSITKGPIHLYNELKYINSLQNYVLSKEHKMVLMRSIENNGFFAHPECILLAMLGK